MAERRIGMNPAVVAAHSATMSGYAGQLGVVAEHVEGAIGFSRGQLLAAAPALVVPIPFVQAAAGATIVMSWGSMELAKLAKADILAATASAQELLARLGVNIAEQIDASSASEGYDGRMSRTRAQELLEQILDDPALLQQWTPQQVRQWWDALTPAEQDAFIRDQHWIAGNTNGLPFDRRIEANRLSAAWLLANDPPPQGSNEYLYLQQVVAGDRSLVAFDPAADRIIEMIGELGPQTQDIVSYVPGTTADMQGFYDLNTQQIAQYLVDNAVPPGSTVAFVFKDGEFPTFEPTGVYNASWAASVGDPYFRFQQALGLENPAGIPVTSIEHSFGSSVGGYAEMQGAVFDTRIVLAGIGMTDGWEPVPGTDYYSLTGSNDVILGARERYSEGLDTGYPIPPTERSGFTELDPGLPGWNPGAAAGTGGWFTPPDTGMSPIEQHSVVATAGGENQRTLDHILDILARP